MRAPEPTPELIDRPRHPWCEQFCAYLERAVRLDSLRDLAATATDDPGSLVLLPSFTWLDPKINVGRKTRNPDGPDYLLPVRLTYDVPAALTLDPGDQIEVGVFGQGLGHDLTGTATIRSRPDWRGREQAVIPGEAGMPATIEVGTTSSLRRAAQRALRDAEEARWEAAMTFLRPQMERETDRAISVLRSSSPGVGAPSESVRDTVLDMIAFGIPAKPKPASAETGDPPLLRLIDKCCQPDAFHRADPAKVVVTVIRRDTMNAARSVTGDTRLGVKLRNLADQLGPDVTAAELAAEANRLGLSSAPITEAKAQIALDYRMPVNVSLPRKLTGGPE